MNISILSHKDHSLNGSYKLAKIESRLDSRIRHELHRLAHALWPDLRMLGFVPIHRYRVRKQTIPHKVVWWVERDIPPYDRLHCEAYRVELDLDATGTLRLVVRSGTATYSVGMLREEELKSAFMRAKADPPLIIPRQFGPAVDP